MKINPYLSTISVLLADDDKDDRFFFEKALHEILPNSRLATIQNGEELMKYLIKNQRNLPDVLFLDLNMPRKSGAECLTDIKANAVLKSLPVIIYSTSLYDEVAGIFYRNGAHHYIRKTDYTLLKSVLLRVLTSLVKNDFKRPLESEFAVAQPAA